MYCIDDDPSTVKLFVTVNDPVIMVSPLTSSFAFGVVVPIPTLPPVVMLNNLVLLSRIFFPIDNVLVLSLNTPNLHI